MADPISIAGLVLAIGQVIKETVSYCNDVREAAAEIGSLNTELLAQLFALQGALNQLNASPSGPGSAPPKYRGDQFDLLLRSANQTIKRLSEDLSTGNRSRFGQSVQKLRWHWKKEDVQKHIDRIERVKVWFILLLTTDMHEVGNDLSTQISQLSISLGHELDERQKERIETQQTKALQWLAPADSTERYSRAISSHFPGTCQWFVDGPLYDLFEESKEKSALLWVKGKSGSGKTTLLGHVIQHILAKLPDDAALTYFFCSFDDLEAQDPVNIASSLLRQLSSYVPELGAEISTLFIESQGRATRLTLHQVEDIFIKYGGGMKRLIVVVDAINESQHRAAISESLLNLASRLDNALIIVSSTADHEFDSESQPFPVFDVNMDSSLIDRDIQLYLQDTLQKRVSFSPALRLEAKESIMKEARGTFRYARWQADHILSQRTGRAARKALTNIPQDLNETYSRVLGGLNSRTQDRELLRLGLIWLAVAVRPLRLSELNEAVVIEEYDTEIDDDCRFDTPELLIDLANGLIDHDTKSDTVSLSHSSIKTFLTSDWIKTSPTASDFAFDESTAHRTVMRTCLTYLSFGQYRSGPGYPYTSNLARMVRDYPLLSYAAQNWPRHIVDTSPDDWSTVNNFLSSYTQDKGDYAWWLRFLTSGEVYWSTIKSTHPLYYAASFGYTQLVKAILANDKTVDLEAPGGRAGSTALQVACFRMYLDVATLLVEAGANPLSPDGSGVGPGFIGFSSLFWAKENGWAELVDVIMRKWTSPGSDVDDVLKSLRKEGMYPTVWYAREAQKGALETFQ